MGRWDNKETEDYDKFADHEEYDEEVERFKEEFNVDFNYKEEKWINHPEGCRCPKHEYFEEKRRSFSGFPIIYKYCPEHFKLWHETKDEMYSNMKWWQRLLIKFYLWRKMLRIEELKYAESDMCIWCRFGTGGRGGGGIKQDPPTPFT